MRTPTAVIPIALAHSGRADRVVTRPDGDDDPGPEPPAPATALIDRKRGTAPRRSAHGRFLAQAA